MDESFIVNLTFLLNNEIQRNPEREKKTWITRKNQTFLKFNWLTVSFKMFLSSVGMQFIAYHDAFARKCISHEQVFDQFAQAILKDLQLAI